MVMNLKQPIVVSFFFHLMLFLLIAAVWSHPTKFSGGFRNMVLVDLTTEGSKYTPADGIDPADEPPLALSPPSDEGVSLSDQAVSNPPEKSNKIPEPEMKTETIADPAKIENAEKTPAQRGGFTSPEAYNDFIMLHKKIFGQKAGARVNELIGDALKVNKRIFFGGTAVVSLNYGPDGKLSGVLVDSASPELKTFLEEIGWVAVPAPASYSLGYSGVQVEFTVLEGYLSFKINAL